MLLHVLCVWSFSFQICFAFLFKMFEQDLNWKMEKKKFPSPLPTRLGLGPTLSFPPRGLLFPSPFPLLAPAQRQSARLAAQEDNQRRAPPLPSPQQMTGRPHASVSPTGGAQRSGSSSTLSPARTRVRAQPRARFGRGVSISPDSRPLNTAPKPRNPPIHPQPQPPRRFSLKLTAEIRRDPIHRCSACESP